MRMSVQKLRLSDASTNSTATPSDDDHHQMQETCGLEFGCGPCPRKRFPISFLQCFATTRWALFFLGMGGFIQGFLINGHTSAVISTLERRFALSSTSSGLIASCYEIAGAITVVYVTYVGGHGHKPLWIGWGVFLVGLSGVIFSLPHFFAPPYTFTEVPNVCGNATVDSCTISELQNYRFFFYAATLLAGVGASPLLSLSITYLDENVKQRYSAFYNGILFMFAIVGPGFGYLVGGGFLRYYTFPEQEVSINESSNLWVGAWWLGALLIGIIGIAISLPILMLPRVIPGTEMNRVGREKEMHESAKTEEEEEDSDFGKRFRDFPKCLVVLCRNPTFVFQALASALDALLIGAMAVFGAKYMEIQFGIDPSSAGFYFGILAIFGGAGGQLVGGGVISRFNINMRWMLHMCYVAPVICIFCALCFLITCANREFAGVISAYGQGTILKDVNLSSICNDHCGCSSNVFNPVCGNDHVTYFSPCFAGCTEKNTNELFVNCTCVTPSPINSSSLGTATNGACIDDRCSSGWEMIVFCLCTFALMFFTFLNEASALQVSLRCVSFNTRSFAIGLQALLLRVLGTIPGPLVLGGIFDSTCRRWSQDCDQEGSCLSYDNNQLGLYIFLFIAVGKFINAGLYVGGLWTYKPIREKQETADTEKEKSSEISKKDDAEVTMATIDTALDAYSHNGSTLSCEGAGNVTQFRSSFSNGTFEKD